MLSGGFGQALMRYLARQNESGGAPSAPAPSQSMRMPQTDPARALAQIAPGPARPQFQSLPAPPGLVTTQAQPRAGSQLPGKFAAGLGGYLGFNSSGVQGFPGAFAGLQDRRARLDAPAYARQQQEISQGLEAHLSPQEQALFRAAPDVFLKNYGERFGRPDKLSQGEALFGPDSGGGARALGGVSKPFAEGDSLFRHDPVSDQVDFLGQRLPSFSEETGALGAQTDRLRALEQARHNRAGEGLEAAGLQMQRQQFEAQNQRSTTRAPTEAQVKAGLGAQRLQEVEHGFYNDDGQLLKPSAREGLVRQIPFVGDYWANATIGGDGQALRLASQAVADLALRTFSGAGANKGELEVYQRIYTPQSTDSLAILEQKVRMRQSLLAKLQAAAQSGAPLDQASAQQAFRETAAEFGASSSAPVRTQGLPLTDAQLLDAMRAADIKAPIVTPFDPRALPRVVR